MRKFEFRKGFLRFQRLGPVKFAEQSRWAIRAPESFGMWAFPFPYFDEFYAHHRWSDIAPKNFRERYPNSAEWFVKNYDSLEEVDEVIFQEVESPFVAGRKERRAFFRNDFGELEEACVKSEWYDEKEAWIERVGKKVLPIREFWYSGELYTHFKGDGSVGRTPMSSSDPGVEWTLMSTEKLAKLLSKPGNVLENRGYFHDGKPARLHYTSDHLEVFIPRGKGVLSDRV